MKLKAGEPLKIYFLVKAESAGGLFLHRPECLVRSYRAAPQALSDTR